MFRHAQLESVKAWMADPAHAALSRYARLQRAIRQLILDGVLEVGKPLPASRALAASLGVSRDTVEAAYSQLQAEGFIDRRVGSGSVVSARARGLLPRESRSGGHAGMQPRRLSQRGAAIWRSGGVHETLAPRPFAPGVPETRNFPLATWERLQRQVHKAGGTALLTLRDPQGTLELRRAIADYVNLERGARATPEQVLVVTSSQQALSLCATVLLDAGDQIALEDPVYPGARRAFEAAGLSCVPVPLDGFGLKLGSLQATAGQAKAIFLTPSHQFPLGVTLALERRLAVIAWAQAQQAWIIEDDYDSEFHYAGKPMACVQGLDAHERTIYIGTFSKSLFPGLRLGYLVLPPALVKPMTVARTLQDGHSAALPQLTLARFIEDGHFGAHVRTMRRVYAERRDILAQLVVAHLGQWLLPSVPEGGMQMPCFLHADLPEAAVVDAARRAGVDLLGLSGLQALPHPQPGFLLGFAAYAPQEMTAAVHTLAAVLQGLRPTLKST